MTPAETVIFWVECFIKYWLYLRRLIENHQNPLWIFNSLGQKTFQTKNKSFHKMFLLVKLKRKKKHIKTAYLGKKNGEKNKGWKIKKLVDFIYQCKKKVQLDFSLWNICQRINSFHFVSMFRLNVMVLSCNTVMLVMPLI